MSVNKRQSDRADEMKGEREHSQMTEACLCSD